MEFIIDFYKGLDTINTIIFWGIIIVIILLLVFSIILANKNKKLKTIIVDKQKQEDEIPVKNEIELPTNNGEVLIMKDENLMIQNEKTNDLEPLDINETKIPDQPVEVEKQFIAEEHVMEYKDDLFLIPNIEKNIEKTESIPEKIEEPAMKPIEKPQPEPQKKEIQMPTRPYERNVLREMSLSQTSPIGIVKKEENVAKIESIAKELNEALNYEEKESVQEEIIPIPEPIKKPLEEKIKEPEMLKETYKNIPNKEISPLETISEPVIKDTKENNAVYLEEVSKKLAEAENNNEIDRTDYELKQEEEAIISYTELMEKKDQIKTIDEEDAVISIDELIRRKNEKEKLYNITESEENDDFINELKKFRSDL